MDGKTFVHVQQILTFLLSISAVITDGLLCYQCADSSTNGRCQADVETMQGDHSYIFGNGTTTVTSGTNYRTQYVKNCTGTVHSRSCIIQTIASKGETLAYIRDCSDGISFPSSSDLLSNLTMDNTTRCDFQDKQFLVCVTLCNTHLCNGPQSNGQIINVPMVSVMSMLVVLQKLCKIN